MTPGKGGAALTLADGGGPVAATATHDQRTGGGDDGAQLELLDATGRAPFRTASLSVAACKAAVFRWATRGYIDAPDDTGDTTACWTWKRRTSPDGYGQAWVDGATRYAHRVALVASTGADIPRGLQVDHRCRNRACLRPSHLEAVDPRTNMSRSSHAGASTAATGTCRRGHDVAGANVRQLAGGVGCSACHRATTVVRDAARRGRPFQDVDRARLVLADAYWAQYLGLGRVRDAGRATYPDDLAAIAAWTWDAVAAQAPAVAS